ncbi:MAG: aminodeoxychorismate/anthranilate synthase component II [Bacteroidota bacterium]
MKTLILDNYDSFTYNLVHIVEQFTEMFDVFRNDQIQLDQVEKYEQIIISPGPGLPSDAGITLPLLEKFAHHKKILGVCLGHQAIAELFGASLFNLEEVLHGISSLCKISDHTGLFKGLPKEIEVGHYHSWAVDPNRLAENFDITAVNESGLIMAIEHKKLPITGVQFHPESVLTPLGRDIIKNWIYS